MNNGVAYQLDKQRVDKPLHLYLQIMRKISRKIFNENISDADAVKALALLIFVKIKYPTSVVPNFSYYKLKKATGLHINTIKARMNTLADMELIETIGKYNQHTLFKKVRAPKSNVNFSMIDTSSVRSIEIGLRALFLQEKVCQKNYVKQLIESGNNASNLKEIKKAKRKVAKRGYTDFKDNGISYAYLAEKLNVGLNKVSSIIKYAENNHIVVKHKHITQYLYVKGQAMKVCAMSENKKFFATKNNIYSIACNTYSLHNDCLAALR